MRIALLLLLLLDGCITCTQQVQQRESQAGKMEDVSETSGEDSKEERETDVAVKVPLKLP
jgi:hypothetical protein